jgi:hypothetical protein
MRKDAADAWTIGANPHGKHAIWPALEGSLPSRRGVHVHVREP